MTMTSTEVHGWPDRSKSLGSGPDLYSEYEKNKLQLSIKTAVTYEQNDILS